MIEPNSDSDAFFLRLLVTARRVSSVGAESARKLGWRFGLWGVGVWERVETGLEGVKEKWLEEVTYTLGWNVELLSHGIPLNRGNPALGTSAAPQHLPLIITFSFLTREGWIMMVLIIEANLQ